MTLTSPGGAQVVLHDETGGDAENLIRTYSSENFPPLRALNGAVGHGDRTLRVADLVGQDVGTLVRWSLELMYAR